MVVMASERTFQNTFFGVSALLFAPVQLYDRMVRIHAGDG
jgi:hypothetical protein